MNTMIAPEAIGVGFLVSAARGIVTIFVGGSGKEGGDRLSELLQGRFGQVGVFPLVVDADPGGGVVPFSVSRGGASFFRVGGASVGRVLAAHEGAPDTRLVPVTAREARGLGAGLRSDQPGFGGQPVPSRIAAELGWEGLQPVVEDLLAKAQQVASAQGGQQGPLVVLVGSVYGGTGAGSLAFLARKVKELRGEHTVAVFVMSHRLADEVLEHTQRPAAHARGIAALRELQRRGVADFVFWVGADLGSAAGRRRAAAREVVVTVVANWIADGAGWAARAVDWSGHLDGHGPGERNSAVGAAQMVLPVEVLARAHSFQASGVALSRIVTLTPGREQAAAGEGLRRAGDQVLAAMLGDAFTPGVGDADVARVDEVTPVRLEELSTELMAAGRTDLVLASAGEVLARLPGSFSKAELSAEVSQHRQDCDRFEADALRAALGVVQDRFVVGLGEEVRARFGEGEGVDLAAQPDVMVVMLARLRAEVSAHESAADVLEATLTRDLAVPDNARDRAHDRVHQAADALPDQIKVKGRVGRGRDLPGVNDYTAAYDDAWKFDRHGVVIPKVVAALRRQGQTCRQVGVMLEAQLGALRQMGTDIAAELAGEKQTLARLDDTPNLVVLPATTGGARARLADAVDHAAAGHDPDVATKLLGGIRLRCLAGSDDPATWVMRYQFTQDVFVAALGRREEMIGATTQLRAVGDTTIEQVGGAWLPVTAYALVQPLYAALTPADALAVEFAHTQGGGQLTPSLVQAFVNDRMNTLRRYGALTLRASQTPFGDRGATVKPVEHLEYLCVDPRPAAAALHGIGAGTAAMVQEAMTAWSVAAGLTPWPAGAGQVAVITIDNGIDWSSISDVHGASLRDYLAADAPVHQTYGARCLHDIEKAATASGALSGRLLDPRLIDQMTDKDALAALLKLFATATMPTDDTDLDTGPTYRLDTATARTGHPNNQPAWHNLGTTLVECVEQIWYHPHHAAILKAAVKLTWKTAQAKVLADAGGDPAAARNTINQALHDLGTPNHPDGTGGDRYLGDLHIIAHTWPETTFTLG